MSHEALQSSSPDRGRAAPPADHPGILTTEGADGGLRFDVRRNGDRTVLFVPFLAACIGAGVAGVRLAEGALAAVAWVGLMGIWSARRFLATTSSVIVLEGEQLRGAGGRVRYDAISYCIVRRTLHDHSVRTERSDRTRRVPSYALWTREKGTGRERCVVAGLEDPAPAEFIAAHLQHRAGDDFLVHHEG